MLLSLQRRFDKLDGQPGFEMPFDVTFGIPLVTSTWEVEVRTMQEPHSRVISHQSHRH